MYDLIVVGAGPAGCTASEYAAKDGAKVLLVDKKTDIGIPVHCGEYIPSLDEMKILAPESKNLDELFNIPTKYIANNTRFVNFIYNGEETKIRLNGLVLERKLFDKYLVHRAIRAGADLKILTRALCLLEGGNGILAESEGVKLKIPAKVVVGADGAYSLMGRISGLNLFKDPMDYGVALQFEMSKVETDNETVEMYFGNDYAPGSYAWIIPKGDGVANVGIGVRTPYMERGTTIYNYLKRFIKKHPVAAEKLSEGVPTALRRGLVPVGGPISKTFNDDLLLVGDAASQTLASVGGGIPPAMICGRIAGKTVAVYMEGSCLLSEYEVRWRREIGGVLNNSLRVRRMGDALLSSQAMDLIIKRGLFSEGMLKKFVRCKFDVSMLLIEKILSRFAR